MQNLSFGLAGHHLRRSLIIYSLAIGQSLIPTTGSAQTSEYLELDGTGTYKVAAGYSTTETVTGNVQAIFAFNPSLYATYPSGLAQQLGSSVSNPWFTLQSITIAGQNVTDSFLAPVPQYGAAGYSDNSYAAYEFPNAATTNFSSIPVGEGATLLNSYNQNPLSSSAQYSTIAYEFNTPTVSFANQTITAGLPANPLQANPQFELTLNNSYGPLSVPTSAVTLDAQVLSSSLITTILPPSQLDLAKMAQSAYTVGSTAQIPAPIDGYSFVKSVIGPGGFAAEVFKNGDQIAVAFRGTSVDNSYNAIKTLLADSSFTASNVDPDLLAQLNNAANLLVSIANDPANAGDTITLTGHSLGGAIAQILGSYTHLSTVVFDAPGAGDFVTSPAVQDALQPLLKAIFQNSGADTNLRVYGDQVSVVGTPIGVQQTIATTFALKASVDNQFIPLALTALGSHSVNLLVDQLAAGAPISPGVTGPKATISIAVGEKLGNGIKYASLPVVGYANTILDPIAGDAFLFAEDGGSPPLFAVSFPILDGVSTFDLEEWVDGAWGPDIFLDPTETFDFDAGVSQFQFSALGALGDTVTLPPGFVFDVQFANDGLFTGEIAAVSSQTVPEPMSFSLFGAGFAGALAMRRRKAKARSAS